MHDDLDALAMAISLAHAALEEAESAAAAAVMPRDRIAGRLQTMRDEHATIVTRRAAGEQHADDGPRLYLIGVDSEALEALLGDAQAKLADANAKCAAARTALVAAQHAYRAEEKRVAMLALDARADRLLELVGQALAQRNAASAGLPLEDCSAGRMTARLRVLDALLTGELAAVRALPLKGVPGSGRPIWHPSREIQDNVFKLTASDGRFW